jgi:hypothetical protein
MRALFVALALALLLAACDSSPGAQGKYVAATQDGRAVTLTLKPGFTGDWETPTDSVPVRWEERRGEIWLHAKGGGVLRGVPRDGALVVTLPGEGELVFRRPGK